MRSLFRKLYQLELNIPGRLFKALLLRLQYGRSFEDADALGLLDLPISVFSDYAFSNKRHQIPGALPPQQARILEEDKLIFSSRLVAAGLPVPPILAVIGRRADTTPLWQGSVIESAVELSRFVESHPDVDSICKPVRGGQGWDILAVEARDGQLIPSSDWSNAGGLFDFVLRRNYSPFCWMIQQRERPHPDLRALMPGPGLGTVRIHSARSVGGDVQLRWPLLKIPGPGAVTDNWHSGRRSGLIAALDVESGELGMAIGRAGPGQRARFYEAHPRTGSMIKGMRLPCWEDLCRVVIAAAHQFPELPALGWDVAITERGPVIIEANWRFAFEIAQTAHREGLKREITEFFAFTQ